MLVDKARGRGEETFKKGVIDQLGERFLTEGDVEIGDEHQLKGVNSVLSKNKMIEWPERHNQERWAGLRAQR